jgi:hypothetical protein
MLHFVGSKIISPRLDATIQPCRLLHQRPCRFQHSQQSATDWTCCFQARRDQHLVTVLSPLGHSNATPSSRGTTVKSLSMTEFAGNTSTWLRIIHGHIGVLYLDTIWWSLVSHGQRAGVGVGRVWRTQQTAKNQSTRDFGEPRRNTTHSCLCWMTILGGLFLASSCKPPKTSIQAMRS